MGTIGAILQRTCNIIIVFGVSDNGSNDSADCGAKVEKLKIIVLGMEEEY